MNNRRPIWLTLRELTFFEKTGMKEFWNKHKQFPALPVCLKGSGEIDREELGGKMQALWPGQTTAGRMVWAQKAASVLCKEKMPPDLWSLPAEKGFCEKRKTGSILPF